MPEVFNPRLRDRSCYLEAPACYIFPIRPEISSAVTTLWVRIRPSMPFWSTLPRKKMGCKPGIIEKRFRRRTWRSCSPVFIERATRSHESWHKPSGSSRHAISDSVPGGRPSNQKVAHLLFRIFVLVQRSRAAAFSRYEAGLMIYLWPRTWDWSWIYACSEIGKMCVCDVTKLYEVDFHTLHQFVHKHVYNNTLKRFIRSNKFCFCVCVCVCVCLCAYTRVHACVCLCVANAQKLNCWRNLYMYKCNGQRSFPGLSVEVAIAYFGNKHVVCILHNTEEWRPSYPGVWLVQCGCMP